MKKICSIIVLLLLANSPVFCQVATDVVAQDTRFTATTPDSYSKHFQFHFKMNSWVGLPGSGNNYASLLGLRGWSDNTGGKAHELAFTDDNQLRIRSGFSPSWEAWRRILMEDVNGNIGIGTLTPQSGLHLHGKKLRVSADGPHAYLIEGYTNGGSNDNLGIALHDGANSSSPYLWIAKAGDAWGGPANKMVIASSRNAGTTKDIWIYASDNLVPSAPNLLVQANTGSVGIGTTNPGSFKLAVEGKIGARKVVVTQSSPWPDYVFHSNYKLPSLKDVEAYIRKHHHLPDVPSAKEVKKDGLDIGDNQAVLLKKIEEQMLYILELNKRLEEQTKRIEKLQAVSNQQTRQMATVLKEKGKTHK